MQAKQTRMRQSSSAPWRGCTASSPPQERRRPDAPKSSWTTMRQQAGWQQDTQTPSAGTGPTDSHA